MAVEKAYLAHSVLDYTAHVTDGDERTCSVKEAHHLLPRDIDGGSCRSRFKPAVPCSRNSDEEQKYPDLQDETTEDDVLTSFDAILIVGLHQHTSTATLDEETKNISSHKDLCDPDGAYDRVGCGASAHDQAPKDHVD